MICHVSCRSGLQAQQAGLAGGATAVPCQRMHTLRSCACSGANGARRQPTTPAPGHAQNPNAPRPTAEPRLP